MRPRRGCRQRKVCSPGFAWGFSDNASSRLTRILTAFFRFKSTYMASMMPRSHGRVALQSDRLRNAQTDIGAIIAENTHLTCGIYDAAFAWCGAVRPACALECGAVRPACALECGAVRPACAQAFSRRRDAARDLPARRRDAARDLRKNPFFHLQSRKRSPTLSNKIFLFFWLNFNA